MDYSSPTSKVDEGRSPKQMRDVHLAKAGHTHTHTQHRLVPLPAECILKKMYLHVLFWAIAVGTATLAWLGALVRAALATWASVEAMVEVVVEESVRWRRAGCCHESNSS